MRIIALFIASIALSMSGCRTKGPAVPIEQVRPEAIRAHMKFLADDLLEGRYPGTRGHELAAKYVAAQFEAAGLEPAGDGGTYFQQVPLLAMYPPEREVAIIQDGHTDRLRADYDFGSVAIPSAADSSVRAAVVFGNYCVSSPEMKYEDFASIDVRGKILACLDGAPPSFPATERAYHAGLRKLEQASEHGAVGFIDLFVGPMAQGVPFHEMAEQFRIGPDFRWVDAKGQPSDSFPQLRGNVIIEGKAAERLFKGAPKTLAQALADAEAGKGRGFPLNAEVQIHTKSAPYKVVKSPNVVGLLRGSGPEAKNEYVVYTSHLDHLGTGPAVDGDTVFNGAMDNAAGGAALIEIARVLRNARPAPRRSILLVGTTEEDPGYVGLVGADYFAHNPTVPRDQLVAEINIDGLALFGDHRDAVAYGAEHSSMIEQIRQAAAAVDLELTPDPWPEQVMFIRADEYPFVRQGIPSVWLSGGFKLRDPKRDGLKAAQEWMLKVYHRRKDDMNQPFQFEGAAREVKFQALAGYLIADAENRPTWNPGDFFGKTFARAK